MEGILKLKEGHIFWKIFTSLTKPAIVGGILLFMCVMVYYLRAKAQGQIAKVKLLKEMLYLEAKDKEFLLGNISRLAQGKDLSLTLQEGEEEKEEPEEPEMPIDGFADATWKYENNLARNLRLDFEHIPTTSNYTSALWYCVCLVVIIVILFCRILWWRTHSESLESLLTFKERSREEPRWWHGVWQY